MQLLWQREVCNRVSGKKRCDPKQVPKWQESSICFSGYMAADLAMIKIKWPGNDKDKGASQRKETKLQLYFPSIQRLEYKANLDISKQFKLFDCFCLED